MIESYYQYPWEVYKKYFPNGNEKEFNEAFVSFDISEKEFLELTNGDDKYVCLETVVFDKSLIKSSINNNLDIKNEFREENKTN